MASDVSRDATTFCAEVSVQPKNITRKNLCMFNGKDDHEKYNQVGKNYTQHITFDCS
jgi:hypothetical protein